MITAKNKALALAVALALSPTAAYAAEPADVTVTNDDYMLLRGDAGNIKATYDMDGSHDVSINGIGSDVTVKSLDVDGAGRIIVTLGDTYDSHSVTVNGNVALGENIELESGENLTINGNITGAGRGVLCGTINGNVTGRYQIDSGATVDGDITVPHGQAGLTVGAKQTPGHTYRLLAADSASDGLSINSGAVAGTVISAGNVQIIGGTTDDITADGKVTVETSDFTSQGYSSLHAKTGSISAGGDVTVSGRLTSYWGDSSCVTGDVTAQNITVKNGAETGNLTAAEAVTLSANDSDHERVTVAKDVAGHDVSINGDVIVDNVAGSHSVTMYGGTVNGDVVADGSDVSDGAMLTLNDAVVDGNVTGTTGNAKNAMLTLTNSSVGGDFVGLAGGGDDSNVIINSGNTFTGDVVLADGTANNNTMMLESLDGLASARVLSKHTAGSGNTLVFDGVTGDVGNVGGFDTYRFIVPAQVQNGDTMVNVTDGNATDLSGSRVEAGVQGGFALSAGEKVNLLHNAAGITTDDTTYATLDDGITRSISGLTVKADGDDAVILTVPVPTPDPEPEPTPEPTPEPQPEPTPEPTPEPEPVEPAPTVTINPQTRSLHLSRLAAAGAVRDNTNSLLDKFPALGDDLFAIVNTGKIDRLDGDVTSRNTDITVGYKRTLPAYEYAHAITYGIGTGDSDAYGVHADIDQHYVGYDGYIGTVGKPLFARALLSIGHANGNYHGYGFDSAYSDTASYNWSGMYATAALEGGKTFALPHGDSLETGLRYGFAHLASDDASLSTGEHYHFDAINQHSVGVYAAYKHPLPADDLLYARLGYRYDFAGDSDASYAGARIPGLDSKGSTGMLTLGYTGKIAPNQTLTLDVTGQAGQNRGVTGSLSYQLSF